MAESKGGDPLMGPSAYGTRLTGTIGNGLPGAQYVSTQGIGAYPSIPVGLDAGPPSAIPTDEALLQAITVSADAHQRLAMQTPRWNPDVFILNKGWDIIDDMLTVSTYSAKLRLKLYAILYKKPKVVPRYLSTKDAPNVEAYDKAQEAADLCRYVVENIYDSENGERTDFRVTLWNILAACHAGFSVNEIVWRKMEGGRYAGKLGLERFVPRIPKQIGFRIHPFSNKVMDLVNLSPVIGYQTLLPLRKYVLYTYQPYKGLPYGRGDARACAKHVFGINEVLRTLAVSLKRFGAGFLKFTTSNQSKDHLRELRLLADQVESGSSLIVPSTLLVELLNMGGGSLDVFIKALEYHETQIAQEILGQNLTTNQSGSAGSYSLGNVHQDTQKFFTAFPRNDLEGVVRDQVYTRIVENNLGESWYHDWMDVVPEHSQGVWDNEERLLIAQFLDILLKNGVVGPQEGWIRELEGIPAALPEDLPTVVPGVDLAIPAQQAKAA